MKPEFDREIDALLRSRAGGAPARGGLAAGDQTARADHLDADALSAFAEGALPAAARALYSAHLADCDDCRRTATRLALAANVAHAREEREAVAGAAPGKAGAAEKARAPSRRERVAAFFAPRSWRYAMPVAALLCVGVIALVVVRRVPDAKTRLARDEGAERAAATAASAASPVASEQNHATAASDQIAEVSTQTQGGAPAAPTGEGRAQSEVAQRAQGATATEAPAQSASRAVGAAGGGASSNASGGSAASANRQAADLPAPAPPPAAAPATAATPVPETQALTSMAVQPTPTPAAEDRVEIAKDEKARRLEETAAEREQPKARRARRDGAESAGAPAARAANRAPRDEPAGDAAASGGNANVSRKVTKEAGRRAGREDAREDDDRAAGPAASKSSAAETRAVAGRRFRREGDAWIDTAYGGGATTVVRRGSEQYRALVADEPEIGRVASALPGEVVVVWRGRAYRIRP